MSMNARDAPMIWRELMNGVAGGRRVMYTSMGIRGDEWIVFNVDKTSRTRCV